MFHHLAVAEITTSSIQEMTAASVRRYFCFPFMAISVDFAISSLYGVPEDNVFLYSLYSSMYRETFCIQSSIYSCTVVVLKF